MHSRLNHSSRSDQLKAGLIIAVLIGLWYAGKWVLNLNYIQMSDLLVKIGFALMIIGTLAMVAGFTIKEKTAAFVIILLIGVAISWFFLKYIK